MKLNVNTNQEAFDKAVAHMLTMWSPCKEYGGCAYRDVRGGRCAVGALIDDSEYATSVAEVDDLANSGGDTGVMVLIAEHILDAGDVSPLLLARLQTIHDTDVNWTKYGISQPALRLLVALAEEMNLDPQVAVDGITELTKW